MARLPRISPVGVPVHLIQRGNNQHTCFGTLEDYCAYVGWLKEYSELDPINWTVQSMGSSSVGRPSTLALG